MIDSTAIIASGAEIDADVSIGPYCVVGDEVKIGKGTVIESHTVIQGSTVIGCDNRISPFASIGQDPQDKKYRGGDTRLVIGDGNIIREFVTLNRGTEDGGMETAIGDHNLLMAYVHIAHDCTIGSHTIFANAASLAGHVTVEDHVTLGGFTLVHQHCRVGQYAFTGMRANFQKDILPYMISADEPVKTFGPNATGLQRAGFSKETIDALRQAWKDLVRTPMGHKQHRQKYIDLGKQYPEVAYLVEFIDSSTRGVTT